MTPSRGVSRRTPSADYGSRIAAIGPLLEQDDLTLVEMQEALHANNLPRARKLVTLLKGRVRALQAQVDVLVPPPQFAEFHALLQRGLAGRFEGLAALDVALTAQQAHPDRDLFDSMAAAVDRLNAGSQLLIDADRLALEMQAGGTSPRPTRATPSGPGWLWILWTFTLFLNWIAFLYIGYRTRHRAWLVEGAVYFLIVAQYFVVDSATGPSGPVFGASVVLVLAGDAVSLVRVLMARKEYIFRREAIAEADRAREFRLHERIREEYSAETGVLTPRQLAERKLSQCDDLVSEIETDPASATDLPARSDLNERYLRALQARADGEWLLEHATSEATLGEADRKLSTALGVLREVRDAVRGDGS